MAVLKEFLQVWDLMSEVVLQPEVDDLHVWQMAIVCFRNLLCTVCLMQTMGEDLERVGHLAGST